MVINSIDSDTDSALMWQSGDWREPPNDTPPYNGIEMVAVPTYNGQGRLVSLALTLTDFTNQRKGMPKTFSVARIEHGATVLLSAEDNFTISGTVELRFFLSTPNDVVVYFEDISYGLEQLRHHAEGGVLTVPLKGAPTPGKSEASERTTENRSTGTEKATNTNKQPAEAGKKATTGKPILQKATGGQPTDQEGTDSPGGAAADPATVGRNHPG